jgi:hypothetical protein
MRMFGRADPPQRGRRRGGAHRGVVDVNLDAVGRPDFVRTRPEALQVMDRAVGLGDPVEPGALELAVDIRREHPDAMRKTTAPAAEDPEAGIVAYPSVLM